MAIRFFVFVEDFQARGIWRIRELENKRLEIRRMENKRME